MPALERDDHMLARLSELPNVGITVTSLEGRWLQVNDHFCQFVGYTREELAQLTWQDLTPPEDLAEELRGYERTVQKGSGSGSVEKRYIRKDGSTAHALIITVFVPREGNDPPHFFSFIFDIGQRIRAEAALRESERRYRMLAENQNDVVWTTDLSGRFTYVSPSVERLRGYTAEEVMTQSLADVVLGRSLESVWRAVAQSSAAIARGETPSPYYIEVEQPCKGGGTVWTEVSARLMAGERGNPVGMLGVTRDISERKRAQARHHALQAQLQHAMKMEAVGRLAGGVAHDFNNLLTGILGNVSLALLDLEHEGFSRERVATSLAEIQAAAESAADLTRQLLSFSRAEEHEARVVDLNELIGRLRKMLLRTIREDVQLEYSLAPDLHPVQVDPSQMEQVLVNLAVNARDAMPNGGTLRIETSNVEVTARDAAKHPGMEPGPYARLTVSDTGTGMSEEVLARLYEPFFTTKPPGHGTGLGLATAYGAVQQSRGTIDVESHVGRGTTFLIHLPKATGTPFPVERSSSTTPLPKGGETILLVEDDVPVRNLAHRVLSRLGYNVLVASDGSAAIELARKHRGPIDLLFTDVVMPGMGGRELSESIRALHPESRTLYASGYMFSQGCSEPFDQDAGFLAKPYRPDALAHKVRSVLDGA